MSDGGLPIDARVTALELAVQQLRWFVPLAVALASFGASSLHEALPALSLPAGVMALGGLAVLGRVVR